MTHQQQLIDYIGCIIKTLLKTAFKHFFQGSSPWATLILNSMFVVVVHYCVQLLPAVEKKTNIPFIFSFAIVFLLS